MTGPEPYWSDGQVTLHLGDCLDVLAAMPDESVDAVVCDPPYALTELPMAKAAKALAAWLDGDRAYVPPGRGFMGREWDEFVPPPAAWDECLRVLRPGGHLVAFAAPRTADLMTVSIRLAGFEIRDSLHWITGQGFPKSRDIGKDIDRLAGAEREVTGTKTAGRSSLQRVSRVEHGYRDALTSCTPAAIPVTAPATAEAAKWDGWGTALKPSHEPITLARKPFAGPVAVNVLEHGTAALNIDGCRVATHETLHGSTVPNDIRGGRYGTGRHRSPGDIAEYAQHDDGRWPPNTLLAHSTECKQTGVRAVPGDARAGHEPGTRLGGFADIGASLGTDRPNGTLHGPQTVAVFDCGPGCPVAELDRQSGGGASRFFPVFLYTAKAGTSERPRLEDGTGWPTVKPVDLMRWLVRLITPPGGLVLDPFAGSGATAEAAIIEGFRCVLVDRDPVALELIQTRLRKPIQPDLFGAGGAA